MNAHQGITTRMTGGALLRSTGAVGVILVAAACHAPPASAPAAAFALTAHAQDDPQHPPLTSEQNQDIRWLASILKGPANEAEIRTGAAVRLLNMQLPQATEVLVDALTSDGNAIKLAVLEAMQQADESDSELLEAAVAALPTAAPELFDAFALALSRYDSDALAAVASLADDEALATEQRLGAIHVLGGFRTRTAAVQLMNLLEPSRDETEAIIDAVCASLQRGTGLPYGRDAQQWRQWWAHAKDQPREQWMAQIIQRLSEQLSSAEQQIERERQRAMNTEQRLAQSYRDLLAKLSFEEQLAALPDLLDDPLSSVRALALDRVARLLRDSVRIDDELQQRIALRLDDEVPEIRLRSARLLDQLNYADTSRSIAGRLENEQAPEVVQALLELLSRRPSPEAASAAMRWLDDETLGPRAADVIWQTVIADSTIEQQQRDETAAAARDALDTPATPAHARLLAYVGNDDAVQSLLEELDGGEVSLRRRIAEGLAHRGHQQPLLDRADDPAVFPFAIYALLESNHDLTTFRTLVSLSPMEPHQQAWSEAVESVAASLPPDVLIQADDVVQAAASVNLSLRARLLEHAVNRPADELPDDVLHTLSTRLARVLLDLERPGEAYELLAADNGEASSQATTLLHFEAAALAGEYDAAADIAQGPSMWLELLARIEQVNPAAALELHDEIVQRFDEELSAERKAELDELRQRLQADASLVESPT